YREPLGETRQMRITGFDAARMLDRHQVTAGTSGPHRAYHPIRRRADRSSDGGPEIGAGVGHDTLEQWMETFWIEPGRDRSIRDWSAPAAFVRRSTARVVMSVRLGTAKVIDADGFRTRCGRAHLQRLDARVARKLSEDRHLLRDHADDRAGL